MLNTALIVASIAGVVALVSTGLTVGNIYAIEHMKAGNEKAKTAAEEERQVSVYTEALARAAFDLQSRLFKILRQDFIGTYLHRGSHRERVYAIENTTFLVAQFLCWLELTRTEIAFIRLKDENTTKRLLTKQDEVYSCWSTDRCSKAFRIFAGEQRALGEALIVGEEDYTTCMGYGQYLKELGPKSNEFVDQLREEVVNLDAGISEPRERLAAIQHLLVDILELIDPHFIRFPEHRRSRA